MGRKRHTETESSDVTGRLVSDGDAGGEHDLSDAASGSSDEHRVDTTGCEKGGMSEFVLVEGVGKKRRRTLFHQHKASEDTECEAGDTKSSEGECCAVRGESKTAGEDREGVCEK